MGKREVTRLPLPRNARPIAEARAGGLRPADTVMVSFVGDLPWPNPVVYADSGKRYDWSFLRGLSVAIVVEAGVDARLAIGEVFRLARLYPALVDLERKRLSHIVELEPTPRLWPVSFGSRLWQEVFAWN